MPAQLTRRATVLSLVLATSLLWRAPTPVTPAVPQGGAPANTCFVISLYRDLMGRLPDATELSGGLRFLISNGRDVYAASLLASTGYQTVLIQGFYGKFLGRLATGVEVSMWITFLGGVGTDEEIIISIVSSAEYFNQARVGADNTNFIQAVYQDLLGRPASPTDVANGLSFLSGHTHQEFVTPFLSSVEYRTLLIKGWYQTYLRRPATVAEINTAQASLSGGSTDEAVVAGILGSVEYFNGAGLCSVYLPLVRR